MVMTIPALEAVRENFPDSTLVVLAKPWVMPLIEDHPAVDEVMMISKKGRYPADLIELIRVAGRIRKMRFDLAVLFQNAFEAALLAYLGGVRYRVGYNTDGRGWLLSHPVSRDETIMQRHQVEYYLAILRAMGWEAETREPAITVPGSDVKGAEALLSSAGIQPGDFVIGLSPGAIYGPAKRWPPERFARIGDWGAERWGARVLIFGSRGERDICETVAGSMKHPSVELSGRTTLGEAMALIRRCNFFVTNDSGLMHVASALDRPMVVLFGSTNPVTTGPRSPRAKVVTRDMACAPCLKAACPTDYRCMLDITPEDVWEEMERVREGDP
jgi:heptosyltransferase-2